MSRTEQEVLLAIFREEAEEGLAQLGGRLLELEGLEGEERARVVREVFRLAHTLKGSASAVGRRDMAEVAHTLEALLEEVRRGTRAPARALIDASLAAVDVLQAGLARALSAGEVQRACTGLEAVRAGAGATSGAAAVHVHAAPVSEEGSMGAEERPHASPQAAPGWAPAAAAPSGEAPSGVAPSAEAEAGALLATLLTQQAALSRGGADAPRHVEVVATLSALVEVAPRLGRPRFTRVVRVLDEALGPQLAGARQEAGAVEAALLAVDLLHGELQGLGSDEEAEVVLALLQQATLQQATLQQATLQQATLQQATLQQATLQQATLQPTTPPSGSAPTDATQAPGDEGLLPAADGALEATVRVPVALLDGLLYRLDELVAAKLRVDHHRRQIDEVQELAQAAMGRGRAVAHGDLVQRRLELVRRDLTQEVHTLGILVQSLQDAVREVRMVSLGPVLDGFRRMVRDLAHGLGKEALLEVDGGGVRLDKRLIEPLRESLMHLLRNAVDHGLETPAERKAGGKAGRGRVRLSAEAREGQLWLALEDDGRGVDVARVRALAVERGLLDAEAAQRLDAHEVQELIFLPGFSTRPQVTETSGRGVGLDVVRENVSRLGGRLSLESEAGQGTRFLLVLPLSVATSGGLVVSTGKQTYCLPLTLVEEVVALEPSELGLAQGRLALMRHRQPVPFRLLEDVLAGRPSARPARHGYAVVLALAERRLALGVEALLGQEELVVRQLAPGTPPQAFVAGAASLADGRLVAVLEPEALLRAAAGLGSAPATAASAPLATILVTDDSLTTRTMVAGVLQRAGYRVLTAPDGESAWSLLQREQVDLVCSDVEMPHLDGIGLTERVRARGLAVPVILLTSLGAEADRERGAQAGASGYVVKQDFDPAGFLGQVRSLMQERVQGRAG